MIDNTKRLHFSIDSIVEAVAVFLNMEKCDVERVLLYGRILVVDAGFTPLDNHQIITQEKYTDMREKYEDDFSVGIGYSGVVSAIYKMKVKEIRAPERLSKLLGISHTLLGLLLCGDVYVIVKSDNSFYSVGQILPESAFEMLETDKRISYIHGDFIIKEYLVRHLREALDNEYDDISGKNGDSMIFTLPQWPNWSADIESLLNDIEGL